MLILDVFNILHASAPPRAVGAGVPWRHRLTPTELPELIAHSRWRSEQVVLVMDGTGGRSPDGTLRRSVDAGIDLPPSGGGIVEIHARAGGSGPDADAVIEALLDREDHLGRGRLVLVVSSDKRIRAAAAGARARAMGSDEFLRCLADDLRKRLNRAADQHGGRPEFALDGGMDPGRTAYWLRELGVAETPAAAGTRAEDCAESIDPDDLDMGEILKQQDAKRRAKDQERK